jgi:photosystem II stability/assembly factor-like uncharacterized protein
MYNPVKRLTSCDHLRLRGRTIAVVFVVLLLWVASADIVSIPASAQPGSWRRQASGTLAWLHSIFFLDQQRGWAVGSKGTLLATSDGGNSWQARRRPTDDALREIYFIDESNGWLLCERNIYEFKSNDDPRSYLMHTTDGGNNWERVEIKGADIDGRIVRTVFRRGGRGWAFGEGGAMFTTHDSGANWVRLHVPTRHVLLGGTFIDEDRGWIVGAGATILQTSDGGDTWHLSRLDDAKGVRFNATSFVDNRLGWAVGNGGIVFRTINGGRTWQQQVSGVATDLNDVKFLDALEGWAVGSEGTIIYTSDGGLHWTPEQTGIDHPLERIFFADRTHGWAIGFGGTIVAYVRSEAPRLRR